MGVRRQSECMDLGPQGLLENHSAVWLMVGSTLPFCRTSSVPCSAVEGVVPLQPGAALKLMSSPSMI